MNPIRKIQKLFTRPAKPALFFHARPMNSPDSTVNHLVKTLIGILKNMPMPERIKIVRKIAEGCVIRKSK